LGTAAIGAAFLLAAFLFRDRSTMPAGSAAYEIPHKYQLVDHSWSSQNSIILFTREQTNWVVIRLNLPHGQMADLPEVAHVLAEARSLEQNIGPLWSVSPTGRTIVIAKTETTAASLTTARLLTSGIKVVSQATAPAAVSKIFWLPGVEQWVALSRSKHEILETHEASGSRALTTTQIRLASSDDTPLGLCSNALITVRSVSSRSGTGLELLRLPLDAAQENATKSLLTLPFQQCLIESAEVSPTGTRILWRFLREAPPHLVLQKSFPFVRAQRGRWVCSLWVSEQDGSKMTLVTNLPTGVSLPGTFRWSPDETRISGFVGRALQILPLPKARE
jgi:hypothetical protein